MTTLAHPRARTAPTLRVRPNWLLIGCALCSALVWALAARGFAALFWSICK